MENESSLKKYLEMLHEQVPVLAERYSVETLEVFGSYVRDEQKKGSDLDILVTFKEEPSLLTFIAIENYLSDLLGVKVDLVMKDSLKPAIGKNILRGRYKGKGLMKAFMAGKKRERTAVE